MKKKIWVQVYKGPFSRQQAATLALDLKKSADPEKNMIHDAKMRRRNDTEMYDVLVLTERENMALDVAVPQH
jgi:CRISPR/Cas system-associated endoribonuclease Cas2